MRLIGDIIAMKTVVLTHKAAKDLDAIEPPAREAILTALAGYAIDGRGDVKRLSSHSSFRLRVGRYRVIFDEDQTTILAIYIGKRETTIYRRN
jgi:mRNA interferase RelE/StbE